MASGAQKTPIARTLNEFAAQKVVSYMALTGYSLPASVVAVSGSIVTVAFQVTSPYTLPQVTMPLAGSEYARPPTQIGDKGFVVAADAYLGGVTGLGGAATPSMTLPANLSALVFFPLGSKNFSATDNPNAYLIYGPDGAIIRDMGKKNTLTITPTGVTLVQTAGGFTVTLPAGQAMTLNGTLIVNGALQLSGAIQSASGGTYAGNIETSGNIIAGSGGADSITLQGHVHAGVTTGGSSTDAPTAGT